MITVSMPFHEVPHQYFRRAVDSVLGQTYQDILLIAVNDCGGPFSWEAIADIKDPRLVRFDLPVNRGRYYADAVTLGACQTEWWSPHDADDWSDPTRFAESLELAKSENTEAVYCDAVYHTQSGDEVPSPVRPKKKMGQMDWKIAKYPAGIYRTDTARAIGGPHPDLRGSFDTAFTSLLWDLTQPSVLAKPYYHIQKRPNSLTTGGVTGHGKPWRKEQQRIRRELYYRAAREHPSRWPEIMAPSPEVAKALADDIERLSHLLVLT